MHNVRQETIGALEMLMTMRSISAHDRMTAYLAGSRADTFDLLKKLVGEAIEANLQALDCASLPEAIKEIQQAQRMRSSRSAEDWEELRRSLSRPSPWQQFTRNAEERR